MGRVMRLILASVAGALLAMVAAGTAAAFDGFTESDASSQYGEEIRFTVAYEGSAPDQLEVLISTPGSEASFVAPAVLSTGGAIYAWDTSIDYLTPNTVVTYRWRAITDGEATLTDPATIRYVDDRPGFDWQSLQLGEATVHWYGGAEDQARRFGEVTAVGVDQAEDLLGTELAGPVDVFVYESQEDFFGALGPGAREWTGAAAYSDIRTIFMWLGGGSASYLEQVMVHEVTHIVFHDATDNPFHEPARWLNEGVATWSKTQSDDGERQVVESEAAGEGLFAFDAITEQFPIGDRGAVLSYAQGTSMVQRIIDEYGTEAIGEIMAAFREGASDEEALEAGTGIAADELYADFYEAFGAEVPSPVSVEPIPPSDVDRPDAGAVDPGGVPPGPAQPPDEASPTEPEPSSDLPVVIALAGAMAVVIGLAIAIARRAERRQS